MENKSRYTFNDKWGLAFRQCLVQSPLYSLALYRDDDDDTDDYDDLDDYDHDDDALFYRNCNGCRDIDECVTNKETDEGRTQPFIRDARTHLKLLKRNNGRTNEKWYYLGNKYCNSFRLR